MVTSNTIKTAHKNFFFKNRKIHNIALKAKHTIGKMDIICCNKTSYNDR